MVARRGRVSDGDVGVEAGGKVRSREKLSMEKIQSREKLSR